MLPKRLATSTDCDRYAPFVYDVWHNPEVLSIVSRIAGVDLVPQMDFEIAHINISISEGDPAEEVKDALEEKAHREADEGVSGCPWEDDAPIVDWHTDSYPFVCVTMLSDCTNMIGGETALRTGSGEIMKVRGPDMVSSVLLAFDTQVLIDFRVTPSSFKVVISNTKPCDALVRLSVSPWSPHSDPSQLSSRTTQYSLQSGQLAISRSSTLNIPNTAWKCWRSVFVLT